MKVIVLSFIFSCLFSTVYALADTLTIKYSVKEHHETAFDYNTKHYKFILIDKGADSTHVLMYVLDNQAEPFSKIMRLVQQFEISKENYLSFRHKLFQLLHISAIQDKSTDAAVISTSPNGTVFRCFGPLPQIIGRLYVKTWGESE